MSKPTTLLFAATAGAVGVAGATAFLIDARQPTDDRACRQNAAAAQGQPTAPAGTRPEGPQAHNPQDCDHQAHHSYHGSGGGAFFTRTGNRGGDDDDAPSTGRTAGSGGESESAGHAGFGASAAGHGGGGE